MSLGHVVLCSLAGFARGRCGRSAWSMVEPRVPHCMSSHLQQQNEKRKIPHGTTYTTCLTKFLLALSGTDKAQQIRYKHDQNIDPKPL
jgi:hypothetical protein